MDYHRQGVQLKEAEELLARSQSELREARGMYIIIVYVMDHMDAALNNDTDAHMYIALENSFSQPCNVQFAEVFTNNTGAHW